MFAAVIWSCARRQSVILWCEDNGPLAFARGLHAFSAPLAGLPEVGDLVACLVEAPLLGGCAAVLAGASRRAHSVRLIERASFPAVDDVLRGAAAAQPAWQRPLRLAAPG